MKLDNFNYMSVIVEFVNGISSIQKIDPRMKEILGGIGLIYTGATVLIGKRQISPSCKLPGFKGLSIDRVRVHATFESCRT